MASIQALGRGGDRSAANPPTEPVLRIVQRWRGVTLDARSLRPCDGDLRLGHDPRPLWRMCGVPVGYVSPRAAALLRWSPPGLSTAEPEPHGPIELPADHMPAEPASFITWHRGTPVVRVPTGWRATWHAQGVDTELGWPGVQEVGPTWQAAELPFPADADATLVLEVGDLRVEVAWRDPVAPPTRARGEIAQATAQGLGVLLVAAWTALGLHMSPAPSGADFVDQAGPEEPARPRPVVFLPPPPPEPPPRVAPQHRGEPGIASTTSRARSRTSSRDSATASGGWWTPGGSTESGINLLGMSRRVGATRGGPIPGTGSGAGHGFRPGPGGSADVGDAVFGTIPTGRPGPSSPGWRKPQSEPRVTAQEPATVGGLSAALVGGVIQRHHRQLRACYQTALRGDPDLAGRVTIFFTIDPAGHVPRADIAHATAVNGDLHSCLRRTFRRMRFAEPAGGGTVEVRYPLDFARP